MITSFRWKWSTCARDCTMSSHILLVLVWTDLVLDIGINTCTMVAGTTKEASVDLQNSLVMKAVWRAYLVVSNVCHFWVTLTNTQFILSNHNLRLDVMILTTLFTKFAFKCVVLFVARWFMDLGRNPRFIVGYVDQVSRPLTCPLRTLPHSLCGEDDVQVVETPTG